MIQTFRRAEGISERRVGETTYLIDSRTNVIHQLNPIGAVIWGQLVDAKSVADLVALLDSAFADIEREVIQRDVEALIDELLDAELIVRCP